MSDRPCIGIGLWLGHKYAPRFSDTSRKTPRIEAHQGMYSTVTIKGAQPRDFAKRTYHGDVCSRCGHVVNSTAGGAT
jgi:hypothetical protein